MPITVSKNIVIIILVFVSTAVAVIALTMAVFNLWRLTSERSMFQVAEIDYSVFKGSRVEEKITYHHILNGSLTETEAAAVVIPIGVVIDNSLAQEYQYGLAQADLVMELPVEGGVTRFLAFFDDQSAVTKIGPVRSVRPYFIDLARGLRALLAHAGGSSQALRELATLHFAGSTLIDVDEIGPPGRYFWRDRSLPMPYNLFTNIELLNKARRQLEPDWRENLKYEELAWRWLEDDNSSALQSPSWSLKSPKSAYSTNITVDYSTYRYQVEYKYDPVQLNYQRYQGGEVYKTRDGEEIRVDNVLIVIVPLKVIDREGRLEMATSGEGGAVVCQLGWCREAFWRNPSVEQRIRFYIDDEEVPLKPGKTWLNIVPLGRRIEY